MSTSALRQTLCSTYIQIWIGSLLRSHSVRENARLFYSVLFLPLGPFGKIGAQETRFFCA